MPAAAPLSRTGRTPLKIRPARRHHRFGRGPCRPIPKVKAAELRPVARAGAGRSVGPGLSTQRGTFERGGEHNPPVAAPASWTLNAVSVGTCAQFACAIYQL